MDVGRQLPKRGRVLRNSGAGTSRGSVFTHMSPDNILRPLSEPCLALVDGLGAATTGKAVRSLVHELRSQSGP